MFYPSFQEEKQFGECHLVCKSKSDTLIRFMCCSEVCRVFALFSQRLTARETPCLWCLKHCVRDILNNWTHVWHKALYCCFPLAEGVSYRMFASQTEKKSHTGRQNCTWNVLVVGCLKSIGSVIWCTSTAAAEPPLIMKVINFPLLVCCRNYLSMWLHLKKLFFCLSDCAQEARGGALFGRLAHSLLPSNQWVLDLHLVVYQLNNCSSTKKVRSVGTQGRVCFFLVFSGSNTEM